MLGGFIPRRSLTVRKVSVHSILGGVMGCPHGQRARPSPQRLPRKSPPAPGGGFC